MFKTNFKSKIVAVMVILGITALLSCEKIDTGEKSFTTMKITNSEICKMHNEVIGSLKNLKQLQSDSVQSMDSYFENNLPLIENSLLEIDSVRYSNFLSLKEYKVVLSQIAGLQFNSSNEEFLSITDAFMRDLKDRGLVSDYFYVELIKLTEMSTTLSNEEIIQYLNSDFAINISDQESDLKELVVLMANSSDELWNSSNLKRPGSSTIIADAIGALWGLPLGGVGSIIYGAAFSLYENEILRNEY